MYNALTSHLDDVSEQNGVFVFESIVCVESLIKYYRLNLYTFKLAHTARTDMIQSGRIPTGQIKVLKERELLYGFTENLGPFVT